MKQEWMDRPVLCIFDTRESVCFVKGVPIFGSFSFRSLALFRSDSWLDFALIFGPFSFRSLAWFPGEQGAS